MSESIETKIELIESDIANAYDECEIKGAVIPQVQGSANLADTIASIQTGKPEVVAPKYVNFVDYDGTVLYAYSRSELQSMTELPPLPSRSGLTCTGWNRTLLSLKNNDIPDTVGAIYSPTDGATRLVYEFFDGDPMQVSINLSESQKTVDWGDNTSISTNETTVSHVYSNPGKYTVKITSDDGAPVSVDLYTCDGCYRLVEAILSDVDTCTIENAFYGCVALRSVSIPQGDVMCGDRIFYQCYSLQHVSIPSGVSALGKQMFYLCHGLRSVSLPDDIHSIPAYAFYSCYTLNQIALSSNVTAIDNSAFYSCRNLSNVIIPSSVTVLQAGYNFTSNTNMVSVDLSAFTSVPVLQSANAFSNNNTTFYVKNAEMLTAFSMATNWSTYAQRMQIGGRYAG